MNKQFFGSLFNKNPLLGQAIGIAPVVLFSSTLVSGLVFGVCSFLVLIMTAVTVSLLRKIIPRGPAVLVFIAVSSSLCVVAEAIARFAMGFVDSAVLWMMPFLVCNSLYIYRAADVYVVKPVGKSVTDALRIGGSFAGLLVLLSAVRELLSYGSLFGISLFPAEKACTFFALPAGGLMLVGFVCALYRFIRLKIGTEAQEK